MLKKMLVVAAILAVAGTTAFGGWNFKFTGDVPPKTIVDADGATVPNPAYDTFNTANYGTSRTVDWEVDADNAYITQRKGEVWNWPATYDYVKIGEINVRMEIGFWIKLDCQGDRNMTLKQRTINTYAGQSVCTSTTNVATDWDADFTRNTNGEALFNSDRVAVSISPKTNVPAGTTQHTIKVKIWDVRLAGTTTTPMTPSKDCINIGVVNIKVRPAVKPNKFMSGGSGEYPVYSPPPATEGVPWF